jgi:hypothetical protein
VCVVSLSRLSAERAPRLPGDDFVSLPLPKLSRAKRGRQNGDPAGSESRRSVSQRKGRYDGGFTPTEQRTKDRLMRQFLKRDGLHGNSEAYRASPVWCWCGRLNGTHGHEATQ